MDAFGSSLESTDFPFQSQARGNNLHIFWLVILGCHMTHMLPADLHHFFFFFCTYPVTELASQVFNNMTIHLNNISSSSRRWHASQTWPNIQRDLSAHSAYAPCCGLVSWCIFLEGQAGRIDLGVSCSAWERIGAFWKQNLWGERLRSCHGSQHFLGPYLLFLRIEPIFTEKPRCERVN